MAFARVGVVTFTGVNMLLEGGAVDLSAGCSLWCGSGAGAQLVKVEHSGFSVEDSVVFVCEFSAAGHSVVVDPYSLRSFVGCYNVSRPKCVEVENVGFTESGCIDYRGGVWAASPTAAVFFNGYCYFGFSTTPGVVYKIGVDPLTSVGYINLDAGENTIWGVSVDRVHSCLYVVTQTTPCKVVKINLSDFSRVGVLNMPFNGAARVVCDELGFFLYVASGESPIRVTRVRVSDFSVVDTITLNVGENICKCLACDLLSDSLYVGCFVSPGRVVRVGLSDFARKEVVAFNVGETQPVALCLDRSSGCLYAGCYLNPGKVVKMSVDVSDNSGDMLPLVGLS